MARNRPRLKLVETVIQGIAQAHVWESASREAPLGARKKLTNMNVRGDSVLMRRIAKSECCVRNEYA